MKKDEWIIEGLIKKGGINIINMAHDNLCDYMKDTSKECNCSPDISMENMD